MSGVGTLKGLTEGQRNMIPLILRSPDRGGGWRAVSGILWSLVFEYARLPDDIAEYADADDPPMDVRGEPEGTAGYVRLTEFGEKLAVYL